MTPKVAMRPAPCPGAIGNSMDLSIEGVLDVGDFHRRCAAHDRWLQANPDVPAFSEQWADHNLEELPRP
jgi:hypothetical protein